MNCLALMKFEENINIICKKFKIEGREITVNSRAKYKCNLCYSIANEFVCRADGRRTPITSRLQFEKFKMFQNASLELCNITLISFGFFSSSLPLFTFQDIYAPQFSMEDFCGSIQAFHSFVCSRYIIA